MSSIHAEQMKGNDILEMNVIYDLFFRNNPRMKEAQQFFEENPDGIYTMKVWALSNGSAITSRIIDIDENEHELRLTKEDFELMKGIQDGSVDVFAEFDKVAGPSEEDDDEDDELPFS